MDTGTHTDTAVPDFTTEVDTGTDIDTTAPDCTIEVDTCTDIDTCTAIPPECGRRVGVAPLAYQQPCLT